MFMKRNIMAVVIVLVVPDDNDIIHVTREFQHVSAESHFKRTHPYCPRLPLIYKPNPAAFPCDAEPRSISSRTFPQKYPQKTVGCFAIPKRRWDRSSEDKRVVKRRYQQRGATGRRGDKKAHYPNVSSIPL